jgi:hypothetical protein
MHYNTVIINMLVLYVEPWLYTRLSHALLQKRYENKLGYYFGERAEVAQ